MNPIPRIFFAMLAVWLAGPALGQPVSGGVPLSFSPSSGQQFKGDPQTLALERVHARRALAEDARSPGPRFTVPLPVDLGLANAGEWTVLPDGGAVWRLKLRSAGALALAFLYDEFYLPPGATFFMYGEDRRQLLGAYKHAKRQVYDWADHG
jgi:hypothetical protein